MRHQIVGACAAIALTVFPCAISHAQTAPAPTWTVVTTTQIKPEFRLEYEAGQKEVTAAYKKAGVPYRVVVQTLLGDVGEYTSISPISKLADMDDPTPLVKALGEPGAQKLLKRLGAYMVSIHRATVLAQDDISIRTPTENMAEYAQVSFMQLYPGKAAAFTSFMKEDYIPAMKKVDIANLWISRPVFGGDLNERVMVRPLHKLAELDGGPLTTKALGADGARQLGIKQSAIVQSTRFTVVRVRPDLSNLPAPPKPKPAD
jgi:hypothetical protein